jgi:hypothetical protein
MFKQLQKTLIVLLLVLIATLPTKTFPIDASVDVGIPQPFAQNENEDITIGGTIKIP